MQEGAYLDFQKAISLKPKEIPPKYTTPGGSPNQAVRQKSDCFFFVITLCFELNPFSGQRIFGSADFRVSGFSCVNNTQRIWKFLGEIEDIERKLMDKDQRIYVYNSDGPEPLLLLWVLWIYVCILVQKNLPMLFVRDTYATRTMIVNHLKCPKPFLLNLQRHSAI